MGNLPVHAQHHNERLPVPTNDSPSWHSQAHDERQRRLCCQIHLWVPKGFHERPCEEPVFSFGAFVRSLIPSTRGEEYMRFCGFEAKAGRKIDAPGSLLVCAQVRCTISLCCDWRRIRQAPLCQVFLMSIEASRVATIQYECL